MRRSYRTYLVVRILLGFSVFVLWLMLIFTNQVAEFSTEPLSIIMHLVAEMGMGLLLILSGFAALRQRKNWRQLAILSLGALVYSVLNSSGYYLQQGQFVMPIFFLLILLFVIGDFRRMLQ